jgi:hypothetical protein
MWEKIFFGLIVIIIARVGIIVVTRFINKYYVINIENKLKYGLVSRKDLSTISNSYFIHWCICLLERMDFNNLEILSTNLNSNIHIEGYKNAVKVYIKCVKADNKDIQNNDDSFNCIEKSDLQRFVGEMEHDHVQLGYIISNGDFTKDAENYALTLPPNYRLILIDGCTLTRLHRKNQSQYMETMIEMEV